MTVEVWPTADELATKIAERLTDRIAQVQQTGRRPSVVLTGGDDRDRRLPADHR
ncbi:hypothetical protein [Aeromicrobium sp. UC242_57]|uniref:hypothetical protein n=1 Tax=Aeromicrobium sp. UC242_57 TaxID=3374624 RepID=UPI00379585B1